MAEREPSPSHQAFTAVDHPPRWMGTLSTNRRNAQVLAVGRGCASCAGHRSEPQPQGAAGAEQSKAFGHDLQGS